MYAGAVVVPAVFGAMGAVGRRCAALGLNAEQIVDALSAGATSAVSAHRGGECTHVTTVKAGIVGASAHSPVAWPPTASSPTASFPGSSARSGRGWPEPAPPNHQPITGKSGPDHDVVAMVSFLWGPAARYITGQAIHANGGAYLGG